MIVIIDNYDSFTYNLVQRVGELGYRDIRVFRNDKATLADIHDLRPDHIIISPGPCTPLEAGVSNDVVSHFRGKIPILGVCLGHQCIGYVYGGKIVRAMVPVHGKTSLIYHDGDTVFRGLTSPLVGGRYHSLVIAAESLPESLEVSARTGEGEIMGVRNRRDMVEGIQFHPESILTDCGHDILSNFLHLYRPALKVGG